MRFAIVLAVCVGAAAWADEKPATKPATRPSGAMQRVIEKGEKQRLDQLRPVTTNLTSEELTLKKMQQGGIDRSIQPASLWIYRDGKYWFQNQQKKTDALAKQKGKMQEWDLKRRALEAMKGNYTPVMERIALDEVGSLSVRISQVLDENNLLARYGELIIWIETPTKGLVDDTGYEPPGVYEIYTTRKYDTALGSKTVFVARRITS